MSATAVRTAYRKQLQELLAASLSVPVKSGLIRAPEQSRDVASVRWEGKKPFPRDGNLEENYFRIRYLKLFKQNQGEGDFVNADALELMAEQLEDALVSYLGPGDSSTPQGKLRDAGMDFHTVTEVTIDWAGQFVEAQIVCYRRNRTAQGG